MTNVPSIRSVALTAAFAVALIETIIAWREQMFGWLIVPIVIATAGTVIWTALAVDALGRRVAGAVRRDRDSGQSRNGGDHERLNDCDIRLSKLETFSRLIAIGPELALADEALASSSTIFERWNAVEDDFASWRETLLRWSDIVGAFDADLSPHTDPITDEETRHARERLPYDRNFSSQDLKVALQYLVLSNRLRVARDRFTAYRTSILMQSSVAP